MNEYGLNMEWTWTREQLAEPGGSGVTSECRVCFSIVKEKKGKEKKW